MFFFFASSSLTNLIYSPRKSTKMVWSPSNYSRKEYFKNYSQSKIVYSSNEWSLSDYRRRVSSTATFEASYEVRSSIFSKKATTISSASPRSPASLDLTSKSEVTVDRSDILGLAAGGQMYGARDLKLLIVSLIS